MSALQEARSLELCQPYFDQPVAVSSCLSNTGLEVADVDVSSLPEEAQLRARLNQSLSEKWAVDKFAALFLSSAMSLDSSVQPELTYPRYFELRMDEPLLANDPDQDLADLRRRNTITLKRPTSDLTKLNDISGSAWHDHGPELASRLEGSMMHARLDVDRFAMELLQGVASMQLSNDPDLVVAALQIDQEPRPERVSLPLLPESPEYDPASLPAEVQQVSFASTPSDLVAREAAGIEQRLMEKDGMAWFSEHFNEEPYNQPITGFSSSPRIDIPSPLGQKRTQDLRVESPVPPADCGQTPPKKVKAIPEDVLRLVPGPQPQEHFGRPDETLTRDLMALTEPILCRLHVEALVEIDTVMRIEVPRVDDNYHPLAPWDTACRSLDVQLRREHHRLLISQLKREVMGNISGWKGLSKHSHALPWNPIITGYGRISMDDISLEGATDGEVDVASFDSETDVHSLIPHPSGLLLLAPEEDADDDELRGREMEYVLEDDQARTLIITGSEINWAGHEPETRVSTSRDDRLQTLVKQRLVALGAVGPNVSMAMLDSTSANLDMFLQLQGRPRAIAEVLQDSDQGGFVPVMGETSTVGVVPGIGPNCPFVAGSGGSMDSQLLHWADRKVQVVISKSVLAQPKLARNLQALLPSLDIIEREDVTENRPRGDGIQHNDNLEADVTLSPSTGLIITGLQRLNQVRLPGQSSYFGIRERLAAVCHRYERLIVLVTNCQQALFDQRACESYSGFIGYAASLDASIEVHYVAGGEEQVVEWMAASITEYSKVADALKLLADETLWERCLRKAGMNAFAAQVVLAKLKASDAPESDEAFGLSAFVIDDYDVRLEKLQTCLGGAKLLRQTAALVDAGWNSIPVLSKDRRRDG